MESPMCFNILLYNNGSYKESVLYLENTAN